MKATPQQLDLESDHLFLDLTEVILSTDLQNTATELLELLRREATEAIDDFTACPQAAHEVSEDALASLLGSGCDRSDIRTHTELSNCVVFQNRSFDERLSARYGELKTRLENLIAGRVNKLFTDGANLSTQMSGHFLYPPGGYMGWHTNSRVPGWRMYLSYAEEPGKSFFRYRDTSTEQVVTSWDERWNLRLFRTSSEMPLWHAVYSETNRYSLGYRISYPSKPSWKRRIFRRVFGSARN